MSKIQTILADPLGFVYEQWGKWDPSFLFNRYQKLAKRSGFNELFFILSFDCDTVEDIKVVWDVHAQLLELGVLPVYAVPGELLKKGEKTYARIRDTGAEFINHGYTEHTYFDQSVAAYRSCFFYDQLSLDTVREDIIRGDHCLKEVLGISAQGFRVPHFGTFQKEAQLRFVHATLKTLGYHFSSSSMPRLGFRHGPIIDRFGILELPVGGRVSRPLEVFDTCGYFMAPDRDKTADDYGQEGIKIANKFARKGVGLLNFYADPIHIHDSPVFFETVARLASIAKTTSYQKLLESWL